jgi:hypothetical protein
MFQKIHISICQKQKKSLLMSLSNLLKFQVIQYYNLILFYQDIPNKFN